MSNRSKIIKWCKDNGFIIHSLNFERGTEHIYGDSSDASSWELKISHVSNPKDAEFFDSFTGNDTISEDIDEMFERILEFFNIKGGE